MTSNYSHVWDTIDGVLTRSCCRDKERKKQDSDIRIGLTEQIDSQR